MADSAAVAAPLKWHRWVGVLSAILRTGLAGGLVWLCLQDMTAVQARAEFAALPAFDYWQEASVLLEQERYSEAELVIDAGLAARPEQKADLLALQERVTVERNHWMHRFQQLGEGALKGTGQSMEALTGAVVADLFVFGDVRDLVIQAGRGLRGEKVDAVLTTLSAAGLVLTMNPVMDLGAALLKFARRIGAMGDGFARQLQRQARHAIDDGNTEALGATLNHMAGLSKRAQPAGAMHILKSIEAPSELAQAALFSQKSGGTFALWLGGRPAIELLKSGKRGDELLLLRAAKRGRTGVQYLANHGRLMLKPHPLLGLLKGLWKGNIPEWLLAIGRVWSEVLLGFAIAWLSFEFLVLLWRLIGL